MMRCVDGGVDVVVPAVSIALQPNRARIQTLALIFLGATSGQDSTHHQEITRTATDELPEEIGRGKGHRDELR